MLRSEMGTQKNFRLEVLDEEETWSFFEKKVGDDVKHPDFREVATRIAKRCGGLPILVETIARTLRGKPIHSWNDALTRLNRSDGKGLPEKVQSGIEWSYNQLDDEDVKSLFLIGGMVSDGYLPLSDLLKYTMGLSLKLFEGMDTVEMAYDRLQSSVDKLKESCLLLDTNDSQTFKMHDLTLDVARNIASRGQHFLSFGNKNEFKEWPNKELLQKCAMMSIDRINISELPEALECRALHLFKIGSKDKSLQIPPNFFKEMKQLKVLGLTYLCIPSLPPSIQSLTSLQTLCLDQCELRDIAIIGELRKLEILSFSYSKFKQLPKEIGRLTRLRWLDLRGCPELEVVFPDVIKSLARLEELNMYNSFSKWETTEASSNNSGRSNASLSELKHLPKLTTLGINIKDANQLPTNFFSERLKHFEIIIGDVWDWDADKTSKSLKLKLSQRNQWDQGLETILKRCEDLSLDVFEGVKNIVYQLDMDGFQRLKKLHIQNNPEITHIVNSYIGHTWIHSHAAFPILEELSLRNLVTLECVCSGQLAIESFRQLKIIKVQSCPKLKKLFSLSTISHFLQLQQIEVVNCNNMKEIIVVEADHPIEFHGLQSLSIGGLSELACFASNPKLHETSTNSDPMQLFNDTQKDFVALGVKQKDFLALGAVNTVVFPKLENLELSSLALNKLWDGHFSERMSWIQNLTSLIVDGCDGLSFLCSSSMAINFVQLKTLGICRCQNMVKIISTEDAVGNLEKMDKMFPMLETLKLEALGKLETFCTSETYIKFPCLQYLDIKDCTMLGSFIINSTRGKNVRDPAGHHLFDENVGFPNLEQLLVEGLHKLTTIWHHQLASDSFYKLTSVLVDSCPSLIHIIGPGILKRLTNKCDNMSSSGFIPSLGRTSLLRHRRYLNYFIAILKRYSSMEELYMGKNNIFAHLKTLRLYGMENLIHVWKDNSHLAGPVFPNLEYLKVEDCGRLKNIVSSAISFSNLVQLEVLECHGLKHLFTCSVAKSLDQLQSIIVKDCSRMIEIVASSDDKEDIDDEITFSRLNEMKLSQLPQLKGFCSRNYNVIFPFLTTLRVASCVEMNISVDGTLLNDSKHEGVVLMEDEEEDDDKDYDNNIEGGGQR
ncbi:hypothetical protein FNV43_RR09555 [Rhamnella rubrinervis]|uniref:NB-ARC domain-containing protein n=1 Tax=Rhamnella rubrinervis TaxID=2594499 RepID=A0A8K0HAN2_9ROSA|nr:hypothetical protein FNV43_RR09555 [Rhamnella rubrinervis]